MTAWPVIWETWRIKCHNLIKRVLYCPLTHVNIFCFAPQLNIAWFFFSNILQSHQFKQTTQNSLFLHFTLGNTFSCETYSVHLPPCKMTCQSWKIQFHNAACSFCGGSEHFLLYCFFQTISCASANVEHFILERYTHRTEKKSGLRFKSGNIGSMNKKLPCTVSPLYN